MRRRTGARASATSARSRPSTASRRRPARTRHDPPAPARGDPGSADARGAYRTATVVVRSSRASDASGSARCPRGRLRARFRGLVGREGAPPLGSDADVVRAAALIDRLGARGIYAQGGDAWPQAVIFRFRQELPIVRCMAAKGFRYAPRPILSLRRPAVRPGEVRSPLDVGLVATPAQIERAGLGVGEEHAALVAAVRRAGLRRLPQGGEQPGWASLDAAGRAAWSRRIQRCQRRPRPALPVGLQAAAAGGGLHGRARERPLRRRRRDGRVRWSRCLPHVHGSAGRRGRRAQRGADPAAARVPPARHRRGRRRRAHGRAGVAGPARAGARPRVGGSRLPVRRAPPRRRAPPGAGAPSSATTPRRSPSSTRPGPPGVPRPSASRERIGVSRR